MIRHIVCLIMLLATSLALSQDTGDPGGGGQTPIVENVWVLTTTRSFVSDTVVVVEPVLGGGVETVTYTRNLANGDFSWYRNGASMGWQQPVVPETSQVSCSWSSQGYYEFTYMWTGPNPAPAEVSFVINAAAMACFSDNWISTGSGTASNGYGSPTVNSPETTICGEGVVSDGKHLVTAQSENGTVTLRTEHMSAHAQSSGAGSSAYAYVTASPTVDNRSVSISFGSSYKSTVAGHDTWNVEYYYHNGIKQLTYLKRIPMPSTPGPSSHGRSFEQDFLIGIIAEIDDGNGAPQIPYQIELAGHCSILGSASTPDHRTWTAPGGVYFALSYGIPDPSWWAMPPKIDPGLVTYTITPDILYIDYDELGLVSDMFFSTPSASGQLITTVLSLDWYDNVKGTAAARFITRRMLDNGQTLGEWTEPGVIWENGSGWIPSNQDFVNLERGPESKWFKVGAKVAGFAAKVQPGLAPVATALGFVGDMVEGASKTYHIERGILNESGAAKIWPDPAYCNGTTWQSLYLPQAPSTFPIGDFKWNKQFRRSVFRTAEVYDRFDTSGFQGQEKVLTYQHGEFMSGEYRVLLDHNNYPIRPPAAWEQN